MGHVPGFHEPIWQRFVSRMLSWTQQVLLFRAIVIGTQNWEYYARPLPELWAIYEQEKNQPRKIYEQFMSSLQFSNFEKILKFLPGGLRPLGPLAPGWEDFSKNALGWEDLSKNAFFKRGLKTYLIKRLRSRDSILYRFHRKWLKLWWFTSVREKPFKNIHFSK